MRHLSAAFVLGAVTLLAATARADDWPQWLGPQRDGVWRESGIVQRIPEQGLPVKWRAEIAYGYAGPAVAGGRVFVTDFVRESGQLANSPGSRNELAGTERVLCLDAETGELLWKHEYRCDYNLSYAGGPRATPTVDDGRVFALGAEGRLSCLDALSGKPLWAKELTSEYQIESPYWGFSAHPLVDGRKLICMVGGEGSVAVAFDKETGREIWRALSADEDAGYCPPTMIQLDGKRQLVIWHPQAINGLDPETGEVAWSQPLQPGYGMSITAPRQSGRFLFASGIGNVGALFRLAADGSNAEVEWRGDSRTAVYCSNSTPIIDNGVIYGVNCDGGQLVAAKLETGERLWETFQPTTGRRRANHGTAFLVKHQDRYVIFNETGDLILARLTPEGYQEQGRFHVLEPTNEAFGRPVVWSHPALANKCLYARNDKEIVCVSLAKP